MDLKKFYGEAQTLQYDAIVGGGDSLKEAEEALSWLKHFDLFQDDMKVLDFGCGFGRLAALFLRHMGGNGFYCGVDIAPQLVEFAKTRLEPAYRNSLFYLLNQNNDHYNQQIASHQIIHPTAISDMKSIGSNYDLIVNFSVFTHLNKPDAEKYISDFYHILKPGGKLFITTFFINDEVRRNIAMNLSQIYFLPENVDEHGLYFGNPADKLSAIGYTEADFINMTAKRGFSVEQIYYGKWCGRRTQMSFQDIIILRKSDSMRLPEDFSAESYLEKNPDVRAAGVNPAYHYLQHGIFEGRKY